MYTQTEPDTRDNTIDALTSDLDKVNCSEISLTIPFTGVKKL